MNLANGTIRTMLLVVLALGVLLVPAGSAQARPGMELALQDDALFVDQTYPRVDREEGFLRARQMGVTRLRVNMYWRYVSPAQCSRRSPRSVRYNFVHYDSLVDAAAAHGLQVQFALTGPAPAWANGKRTCSSKYTAYKPQASRFSGFARAVAKHFRGRVHRYSIWNEPNHLGWIAPRSSAARIYRSLYRAGYNGIKREDPGAQVLFGETSPFILGGGRVAESPLTFLSKVTCTNRNFSGRRCAPLYADGYAHHPYDFVRAPQRRHPSRGSVTMATLGRLTQALTRLKRSRALRTPRGAALDLWLTEYGYLRSGSRRMSENRRAVYLKRAYTIARRNSRVHQMTHYLLITPRVRYRFFDTSLMNQNGSPYRSWRVLRSWAN